MPSLSKIILLASAISLGMQTSAHARETVASTPVPTPKSEASADQRAEKMEAAMTQAERIGLIRGRAADDAKAVPPGAIGSAGYTAGVPRLQIPTLQETDAGLGVAWVKGMRKDGATALPSSLSLASTWNPRLAYEGSALIAREARAKGFNVLLAGGVNLARDPRNGRNFEYLGEDPLLSGILGGQSIKAIQDSHMLATVKHFAANGQETGRNVVNSVLADSAAHDSDLLAFRLAIDLGHPGAVMCAYNRYNGPHACQSDYLLNHVLKTEWHFPGFAMSDWGATYSAKDILAGLDFESGEDFDDKPYFADELPALSQQSPAIAARIRDATRRVLRSMYASGLFDDPPQIAPIDAKAGADIAQGAAAAGIVLLKNNGVLPLLKSAKRIAVIGGYADVGVMAGGGSSSVMPVSGPVEDMPAARVRRRMQLHPSSPLAALKAKLGPDARIDYDQGYYPPLAAQAAKDADVAIVFVTQWSTEGQDLPDLTLPQGQDALISAVAAANPHTIVVLETGNPVLMPWLPHVSAVLETWYPGIGGGPAIADVLVGDVNPSGHLPITFPASLDQLPRPTLDDSVDPARSEGSQGRQLTSFDVDYNIEGADVGYRWFQKQGIKPLFPFGFGLSYTTFSYSRLHITGGKTLKATFTVKNDGTRAGTDVPQVYVTDRAGHAGTRLIGWANVSLAPGEQKQVTVTADPKLLGDWSSLKQAWIVPHGRYQISVGHSVEDKALRGTTEITQRVVR